MMFSMLVRAPSSPLSIIAVTRCMDGWNLMQASDEVSKTRRDSEEIHQPIMTRFEKHKPFLLG